MSLEGTDRYQSPYEEMKRERNRVNIALFPGPKTRVEGDYKYCSLCHRNLVTFDNNTLICPNCGQKREINNNNKPAAAENTGLKQKNPPISKLNTFVVSSKDNSNRNKKRDSDTKKDLQQIVGSSGGFIITDAEEIEL